MMKLQAKARLQALMKFPVRNDSQRGYLVVIGLMVNGDRKIGNDCRATVARYIIQHPDTGGRILLVAHADDGSVYHTLLVDEDHRKLADAYNGKLEGSNYTHRANQEILSNPVIAAVPVKEFMRHLLGGTFETWVSKYPN